MCSVSKLSQFGARADFYIFFQIYVPLLGRNNSANWPRHLAIKREGAFIIFLRCMTSGIPPLPFKRQAHFHCRFAPLALEGWGQHKKTTSLFPFRSVFRANFVSPPLFLLLCSGKTASERVSALVYMYVCWEEGGGEFYKPSSFPLRQ